MNPFGQQLIDEYTALGAWGDKSLYQYLSDHANSRSDETAVVDAANRQEFASGEPQRFTWAEFATRVDSLASALHSQGVASGDVVLVQLPNIWELVATYFAVARIGAIMSPIAIQYRARELGNAIDLTQPVAFISTTNFKGTDHAAYFCERFPEYPGKVLVVDPQAPPGCESLHALTEGYLSLESGELPEHQVNPNSICTVCWTSGTTGMPKGVPRTHNNWRASGIVVGDGYGIEGRETLMLPFPLINTAAVGGVMMPWLMCGGTLVLHHPFNVNVFLKQLVDEKVTITLAAPALLDTLLDSSDLRDQLERASLKCVGVGSAPPSPKLMREYQERFDIAVNNMFGSNEGFSLCSDYQLMPDPEQRALYFPRPGLKGYTWTNRGANWMKTRLFDPESRQLIEEPGKPGELSFKSPSLFPGYYNRGELNRDDFDEGGYFSTGDLFEIVADEKGPRFLKVLGRKKEIIIRGGFNISPTEIDGLLAEIPEIVEAAVGAYADERLGERICAYVVAQPGAEVTLKTIGSFLEKQGLAKMKWPEKLVFLEKLPRNALNKVVRGDLAKQPAVEVQE